MQGRVTVMSRQPLNVAEAIALLNTVLTEQGYAAVRTGRVLKIVTLEDAKRMNVPVRAGSDPSRIEPNDEVITQIMPLKFADAVQVRQDLAALIPAHADLSANASSNALILTDTGANVRRIAEIVSALDKHMATVAEVRVFQLTYADASDAADLINEVFEQRAAQTQQGGGRGGRGGFFPGRFFRGPGGEQQQEEPVSRAPEVLASADERTNTVVVSGPTDTLDVVAEVIQQLDANPVAEESVLVYPLKNANAERLAALLNDLFKEADETTGAVRTARQQGQQQGRGAGGFFQRLRDQAAATAEGAAGLAGNVFVVADADTNSLLILTAPANFDTVRGIVEELDRPIPQVLIKVLIAEVTWNDDLDVGVEFSILDTDLDGDEFSLSTDFGLGTETGGLIYRHVIGDVTAVLRALEELGKLDVLSRPHILTSDNQTATITVGQEVPFIRNTRTTETGQTINTIEYEDIGIILEVTPHINPEGLVIMDVSPEISTTTAETVPISETVDAAVFAKRSAQTHIAIHDNQTIVIGGLMEDALTERVTKVPILGDIPLLGALFRRTERDKDKTELLIFLTPHVAREADELQAISQEEMTGVRQMKEAVAPGVFDEHMRGMRLGGGHTNEEPEAE
ncbi:MAG: hypothetical protein AMK73_01200 [Planctomycetes bacterium SM23_32]|nr:MAG: hypothetical protein AMK73_01200 [Planctomycetes bacterium SM23_32]